MTPARKILFVAIGAEVILIATGLFLAYSQGLAAFETHQKLTLAASAAGFPLLLAVMELFKIPAGWALYRARWFIKPFAVLILVGGMVATFETVTMAGSTWFRSIQYEVTVEQSELAAMKDRSSATATNKATDDIKEAIDILDEQIATIKKGSPAVAAAQARVDDLTNEVERFSARMSATREQFGEDWDTQTDNNTARIQSGDKRVADEAVASQKSLPGRSKYVDQKMANWQAQEGKLVISEMQRLEGRRNKALEDLAEMRSADSGKTDNKLDAHFAERSLLQKDLSTAIADARAAMSEQRELSTNIEKQTLLVAKLARNSLIYDLAAKIYAVPIHEVSEEQANWITALVILGVGIATAMTTGLAAFISAHLDAEKRSTAHLRALRLVEARSATIQHLKEQLSKKPKSEYRDRVVYRYLPIDRDLHPEPDVTQLRTVKEEMKDAA